MGMRICLQMAVVIALAGPSLAVTAQLSPPERTDAEIADRSSDIFVARIEAVVGHSIAQVNALASVGADIGLGCAGPCVEYGTLYEVTVLEVVKGRLQPGDVVDVEQQGGEVEGDSSFYEGDGPMRPGEEYLLATTFFSRPGPPDSEPFDWHSINGPGQGNILLESVERRQAEVVRWTQIVLDTPCELTDVLRLNGTVYSRKDFTQEQPYFDRDQVGRSIATVERTVPDIVPCRDELAEGDATVLAEGTKVQAVKGYELSFRVAVRHPNGNRNLYEALWSESAQTAADLYDIRGRVVSISASMYTECRDLETCEYPPMPRENANVERMVRLLLSSPVDAALIVREGYAGTHSAVIVFHLDDGSTVALRYGGATSSTLSGVQLHFEIGRELWTT